MSVIRSNDLTAERQKNLGQKNESLESCPPLQQATIFFALLFFAFLLDAAEGRSGFLVVPLLWSLVVTPTMDVFVLGEAAESPYEFVEPNWPIALQVIPTGVATLPEFARSPWADRIREGEADFAAIVTGSERESLRGAFLMTWPFGNDPDDERVANLMIERIDPGLLVDPTSPLFQGFQRHLVLLAPRAAHASVVFRRSKFEQVGPLRPVAEPVWDWLIRASCAGHKINATPVPDDCKSSACRLPLLAPPRPTKEANWLLEHLTAFPPATLRVKPASKVDEIALRAGLFQWHDFLTESHELSQSIEGQGENQLGDFWHAIMHRREPDYSNAKYWFRRIGNQPIFRELRLYADGVLEKSTAADAPMWRDRLQAGGKWDPFAFIDLCEECARDETSELAIAARRIQYAEMTTLLRHRIQEIEHRRDDLHFGALFQTT